MNFLNRSNNSSDSNSNDPSIELNKIFKEEFLDSLTDILVIPETKFINRLIHRVNIIIKTYHKSLISLLENNQDIFNNVYKDIYEDYYLSTIYLCNKELKTPISKKEYITHENINPHCENSKIQNKNLPIHNCEGNFLIIKDKKIKKFALCDNCNYVYEINKISVHCPLCNVDYLSAYYDDYLNVGLKPATWKNYHCGIMLNKQMQCEKCNDFLYLARNRLYCKTCNKFYNQKSIKWKCIICQELFSCEAKIYNPLEFHEMKTAVKNAIINQIVVKPASMPCKCFNNVSRFIFKHNSNCDGILYQGFINKEMIVICSKCYKFSYANKFKWLCPICNDEFINTSINTYKYNIRKKRYELYNGEDNGEYEYDDMFTIKDFNNNYDANEEKDKDTVKEKNLISIIKNKKIKDKIFKENDDRSPDKVYKYTKILYFPLNHKIENKTGNRSNEIKRENEDISTIATATATTINKNINSSSSNIVVNSMNIVKKKVIAPRNLVNNKSKDLSETIKILNKYSQFKNCSPGKNELNQNINSLGKISSLIMNNTNNNIKLSSKYDRNEKFDKSIHLFSKSISSYKNKKNENDINKCQNSSYDNKKEDLLFFNVYNYKSIKQLGQGTFGKIYLVEDKLKNTFCLKKMIVNNKKYSDFLANEYKIISTFHHKFILSTLGITHKKIDSTTNSIHILMELSKYDWEKEIENRKLKNDYYKEDELITILRQLIYALSYLQINKVSHRDIKVQNILVFDNNIYKLADFGEAEILSNYDGSTSVKGTELYMAPLLLNALHNKMRSVLNNPFKSDVFSLGLCILYASNLDINAVYQVRNLIDNNFNIMNSLNAWMKCRYSFKYIQLISKMLCINESNRPDFIQLERTLSQF